VRYTNFVIIIIIIIIIIGYLHLSYLFLQCSVPCNACKGIFDIHMSVSVLRPEWPIIEAKDRWWVGVSEEGVASPLPTN